MGVLGWTPKTFWKSTPRELLAALDGFTEKSGGKRDRPGMTRDELGELMLKYPDN